MNAIELSFGKLHRQNVFIQLVLNDEATLDVPEIQLLIDECKRLSGNKPYALLSDARVFLNISPEARKLASDPEANNLIVANAVLVNNLALRILANFFSRINRPHFKFKVFTDKQKAIDWLMRLDTETVE